MLPRDAALMSALPLRAVYAPRAAAHFFADYAT